MISRDLNNDKSHAVIEIPGGHVEDTDATLLSALTREVMEETSLTISTILGGISPFSYTTEKLVDGNSIEKTALQLNYIVTVNGVEDFKVNPDEHSEGIWAGKEDLEGLVMTGEMREVVREGFGWMEREMDGGQ